ncbi:MAG: calcium-translocating P-type ATPase, PMCA-type [Gemmataceae bacterium]
MLSQVMQTLALNTEAGLASDYVDRSRQQFGENRLTPLPREPLWKKFLEKFDEPIIKILLAAALLSMLVDLFKAGDFLSGGAGIGLLVLGIGGLVIARLGEWIPSFLFGLAILLFLLGSVTGHFLVEGLAVMIAVILATGVAFLSEYKSDREFEVLNARKDAINVKVMRDGALHTVLLEEVVVGDVVLLEMGDEVPADGRLVKATDLFLDQSLMTGESEPVKKSARPFDDPADGPDQPACLYRGTQVVDGTGQMIVCEVGDGTYLGQIARKLSAEEEEPEGTEESASGPDDQAARVKKKLTISKELTPLQLKLQHLAELISNVGYVAAVLIFIALVVRGILAHSIFIPGTGPEALAVFSELLDAFVLMVIIIVVAVPEGLPMSVTVSLALAMQKMTRANSLVRQLVACETIGSATVICSDKTGTLTQNKMQVVRIATEGQVLERGSASWPRLESLLHRPSLRPIDWLALNAGVNSTANLEDKGGKLMVVGNSTEGSLLQWLHENHIEYQQLRLAFPPLYQVHFSSERKRMTTVVRVYGSLVVLVKGAPEWVLEASKFSHGADGQPRELNSQTRHEVLEQLRDSASQAMRTLGFAYAVLPEGTPEDEDSLHQLREALEANLTFIGFVAIRDPLRDDVKDAINQCRSAGIKVKMITGDNVETARAIAFDIGLVDRRDAPINTPGGAILTSDEFNKLTDPELKERLPHLAVLARARPLDKFRMVKLLQDLGEVVAVTGDGTNDAPALKKADVGLAMGIAGTEVAKEASKIVLLDDAFSTIVKAVHWGRSLYENIQRFIQFQLTINVSALTIAFLGPLFFGVKAPFTVLQLLWINVIMDTFASIALCSEPPRPGVMRVPPKKKDENILTPNMKMTILTTAAFFVVTMLTLLVLMKGNPEHPGLFASSSPDTRWSFEAAGSRQTVAASDLEHNPTSGEWRQRGTDIRGDVAFTVFQVSLFFSVYVFFQVWNQINCRSLTPDESGFRGLFSNTVFLTIASLVAVGQVVIVTFGGAIFKVEPLSTQTWLAIIAATASVLVFAEVARLIRRRRTHAG